MALSMSPKVYIDVTSNVLADPTTWIDITQWVKSLDFAYGRPRGAVDDFQPGQGSMLLDNRDGRFDPSNTASPYYPNLTLKRRVKVTGYVLSGGAFSREDTLAVGWIEGWPQTWKHRSQVETQVNWTDAFGILTNHDLPDSAWDYMIQTHVDAGRVVAWYRWGDTDNYAIDSSGNGNHGRYMVTSGATQLKDGDGLPAAVVKAAQVDSIMPACNRSSLSLGKLIAETGQPATAPSGTWRWPGVLCGGATALWGLGDFTVEYWILHRAAFSLSAAGLASATTSRNQWVTWWGDYLGAAAGFGCGITGKVGPTMAYWTDLGSGYPVWLYASGPQEDAPAGADIALPSLDDGVAHHVAHTVEQVTSPADGWLVSTYVDGAFVQDTFFAFAEAVPGWFQAAIVGYQNKYAADATFDIGAGSIIGDLVFYNEAITATQISLNHNSGRYGRITAGGALTSGEAADQVLTMSGATLTAAVNSGGKYVASGKLDGRDVVEVLRDLARGEDGLAYQHRDGTLRFMLETWRRLGPAASTQFTLTDDASSPGGLVLGFADCDFAYDDGLVANSVSVTHENGTAQATDATSIAAIGRYERSISTSLADAADAQALAEFRVWQLKNPRLDIGEVSYDALQSDDSITATAQYAAVPNRVRVIRTRPNGTQIDDTYWIMSVRHRIEPANGLWTVGLGLTPADEPGIPFTIDTSQLDSTTEFVWIG